ncbi:MAG: hypothetical protein HY716_05980 [Planctomycetes bacterium]|nr:hypothetical protein [Planctomycetota bacterium]
MDTQSFSLLAVFTIALFHTLIPSHWLCFVLIGRSQGWRLRHTLAVAAVTGTLHVAFTVGLGLALGWAGHQTVRDPEALERIGGFLLVGLGALYLFLHVARIGHHHEADQARTNRAALAALMLAVTLSPCSAAIPILVAPARTGLQVALIGSVLFVTTVGNMMLLIALTAMGIEKLQFRFFDRYEKLILGIVLAAFGAAVILFGHGHG